MVVHARINEDQLAVLAIGVLLCLGLQEKGYDFSVAHLPRHRALIRSNCLYFREDSLLWSLDKI